MKKAKHGRRAFLRGAAGTLVALPLLQSLGAHAENQAPPKRLVTMYTPNGTIQNAWWPTNVTSETSFDLNKIHEPLAAYKGRLTFLGGVDLKVTEVGPGGPHQKGIGSLFTGRELQEGKFADGCGSMAGWANGISVDQRVAEVVSVGLPIRSLELGVRATEADVQARISYSAAGSPLPLLHTPFEVYKRVFAQLDAPESELSELLSQRLSVLDAVSEQYGILKKQVSSVDSRKLEAHFELVRDLETRLSAMKPATVSCSKPVMPGPNDPEAEEDMPQILRLHFELLALAFACDVTRVGSLQISTGLNRIRYPWLGSLGSGHTLSHAGDSDSASNNQIIQRHAWHSSMLAHFMGALGQYPEGDGSVLDSTMVVWCSDVSKGNLHTLTNMPFLVAGTLQGRVPGGRYLQFSGVAHSQLLLSILHAFGIPDESFGHPDYAMGELPGFLA